MTLRSDRRTLLTGFGALVSGFAMKSRPARAQSATGVADLILYNGKITTLDRQMPEVQAVAIRAGRFVAVGTDQELMARADAATKRIDLKGRRAIPGLIDSHMHIIRGGLNYNMELRWDGVRSLADAMRMLKQQLDRTPAPQWVRVIGGFSARPICPNTPPHPHAVQPARP